MLQDAIDELLQAELAEERRAGFTEGKRAALFEVAKRLSEKGYAPEFISEITGLSPLVIKCFLN